MELDILIIDTKIQQKFNDEFEKLPDYISKLNELKSMKDDMDENSRIYNIINIRCDDLEKEINEIQSKNSLNFYLIETIELLTEYKKILQTPIQLNFVGKPIEDIKRKKKIIEDYINIARKYTIIPIENSPLKKYKERIVCNNCPNKKEFDILEDNTYVCLFCFSQQNIMKHSSSYKDIDRINISSKYTYDRRVHFRDTINQHQGKQNSTIEQNVYDDLKDQFKKHYLLVGDENTPQEIRYQNITKQHIMLFLKDLNYTKHYENINLIHYMITGKKPDDIGYLEDKLMRDFDDLTELYDKLFKNIDRKNFINTSYILFQILRRHKHPCKKEDFTMLKTVDRKSFHDDVTKVLFLAMGWNHESLF